MTQSGRRNFLLYSSIGVLATLFWGVSSKKIDSSEIVEKLNDRNSINTLEDRIQTSVTWLPTLLVESPEKKFDLAVKVSKMAIETNQPDVELLEKLSNKYAVNADSLTATSHVIALNFQTIVAANNYEQSVVLENNIE